MRTCWDILGITPTEDRKIIRKAYAEQCRQYHPEENPEEFEQLRHAYETALNYNGSEPSLPDSADQSIEDESFKAIISRGLKKDECLRTASIMERIEQLHRSLPATEGCYPQRLFETIDT